MNEDVGSAAIHDYEAKTLLRIEKFYSPCRHSAAFFVFETITNFTTITPT